MFSLCLLFVKTRCINTVSAYSTKVQSYITFILIPWLQTKISTGYGPSSFNRNSIFKCKYATN